MPTKSRQAATPAAQETGPLFIEHSLLPGLAPRRMEVRIPSPEQIAIWQSVGERFTAMGAQWAYEKAQLGDVADDDPALLAFQAKQNSQAIKGIGRAMKLIKSVLVSEDDYERVEDAITEGATLEYCLGIVTKAVAAMRERAVSGTPEKSKGTKAKLGD
jgi:hypothetical protein